VALVPNKSKGRPRQYPALNDLPAAKTLAEVAQELPKQAWKNITWRQGTKGPMRSRFAQVKVWAAHGWKRQEHPKRVLEWLLIEWPADAAAPTDYWLGPLGRAILGVAAFGKDSACALAGGAGLPGAERRAGTGPLRRTALAGLASSRNAREHGFCFFTQ